MLAVLLRDPRSAARGPERAGHGGDRQPDLRGARVIGALQRRSEKRVGPGGTWAQVAFGASVAAVYGLLVLVHVVAAIFIALTIVCALRGLGLYTNALVARRTRARTVIQV